MLEKVEDEATEDTTNEKPLDLRQDPDHIKSMATRPLPELPTVLPQIGHDEKEQDKEDEEVEKVGESEQKFKGNRRDNFTVFV